MIKEIVLAFIAGIITFVSPCVLPLIPAYIFYITGLKADEIIEDKLRYILRIIFFISGFTVIFVSLGIITGVLSSSFEHIKTVNNIKQYLNIFFGLLVIFFSLHFIGIIKIFFLNTEKRFNFSKLPSGYLGTFLIGMAFAAGWTPCVGPVLATILSLVAAENSIFKGTILLFIFSLGLGLPLAITAMFFNYVQPVVNFLKRHSNKVKIISGIFLFFIGILILSGSLSVITSNISRFAYFLEDTLPISNYIFSGILLVIGLLFLIPIIKNKRISISMAFFCFLFLIIGILNIFNILPLLNLFIQYLRYKGI